MIELRDYQRDLLEQVQKALAPKNARVMMQLPTGGGKTIVAAHLLASYLTGERKAVWITHRTLISGSDSQNAEIEVAGVRAWYVILRPCVPTKPPIPADSTTT